MERVFDICHGCRRCVSLCQSFPTLFDLVDATADGEVHGVDKKDYCEGRRPVLPVRPLLHDQVPVRAAAPVERRLPAPDAARQGDQVQQGRGRRRREVARRRPTCTASSPASRSSSQAVNAVNRTKPVRKLMDGALGVHPDAWMPALATQRFRWSARRSGTASRGHRRRAHAGQGGDLLHLLRQLQRARHRPRPAARCSSTTPFRT